MVGLWAVLVGMALSLSNAPNRGVEMYAFASLFWIKALKSQIAKNKVAKASTKQTK